MTDEERKEYNRKYYKKHKEDAKKYYSERIVCTCGSEVARGSYQRHRRTALHKGKLQIRIEEQKIKKYI